MKIYFNLIPPENEISYGGGLFFVKNLSNYLKKQGIFIANELSKDLDLIFIIDPRKGPYKKYSHTQLLEYCENTKIKLIYIVNECDKKRQNSIVASLLSRISDHIGHMLITLALFWDHFYTLGCTFGALWMHFPCQKSD